ncbi:HAD family hydrolase [Luteolibacter flavescens]|uniref:phosphoglycolate phosphatase n=1 Tax=Luteolibacter flavescens TaxID=1859460 RepID=A0ABT3FQF5_9BACT|nr:HAD family hydrolase [Luteolibacter flavescens]MCW1885682.1 HAD family hydrolase [Luteolibacter flavescens]
MKPGLIFDLDGTLIDSLPGIAASLNRALERCGHPIHTVADVRRFIGNGSYELARRATPEGAADEDILAVECAFKDDYALTWPDGTMPYDGIPECLDRLAATGHRMAILSNKPHPFTVEIVQRVFPGVSFDLVLGQRADTPRKPHPDAALQIARHWDMAPELCRFIGDSTVDLDTARAAGIPAIMVGWGYHDAVALLEAGAGAVVEKVTDLDTAIAGD